MMNGPDHGDFIHETRELWKALINFNVRAAGSSLTVTASILARSIWLHVEHVDMTGPTELEEKDDVLGLWRDLAAFIQSARLEGLRHGHA